MRVPLEIAILLAAVSVWLVWDALHRDESAPKRAALAVSAIGAMMVAVGGRLPVPSAGTALSPFVNAGVLVLLAGMVASIVLDLVALARGRRPRNGATTPDKPTE